MENYNFNTSLLDEEDLREARIRGRVGLYISGTISLDDFYQMEKAEDDDIKAKRQEAFDRLLDEIRKEKEAEDPEASTDPEDPSFTMTKEEFRSLNLLEQSRLYEEHPDEIRKLLEPVKEATLTREEFRKKPLYEQSQYYNAKPEEIRALLEGTVDSVDVEDLI